MSVEFRNLGFDPSESVDTWPAEAIETVIDRGTISDWRRLAEAIRRSPWGPAARTAETVTGWGENYGVDALISRVVAHAREEATLRGRAEYADQIRAWRSQTAMSLRRFAAEAGTSASRLSAYENAQVAPTTDVLARLRHVATLHAAASSASLIITSDKPLSTWGEIFGDDAVAVAMIDRLVHHAEILSLKGDSYRLRDKDLGHRPAPPADPS